MRYRSSKSTTCHERALNIIEYIFCFDSAFEDYAKIIFTYDKSGIKMCYFWI